MKESNTFPWKLHEMLDSTEYEKIVSWLPDGTSFKVHTASTFVKDVLPKFFLQTKYKSFQRQLNIWGFERIATGPFKGGYNRSDLFVRGNAPLVNSMKRRKKSRSLKAITSTIVRTCAHDDQKEREMTECTSSSSSCSSSNFEDEPDAILLSSNVSVSVNGDDQHRQFQQLESLEDAMDNGSEEDIDFVPLSLEYLAFDTEEITPNDLSNCFSFEGNNFFLDVEEQYDPLSYPLHKASYKKDDDPNDDLFSSLPISAPHHRMMEDRGDCECFMPTSFKKPIDMWFGLHEDFAADGAEKSAYEDTSRTNHSRASESQKRLPLSFNERKSLQVDLGRPYLLRKKDCMV
jgi:hypothetical protein